jgi:hypothetical protein
MTLGRVVTIFAKLKLCRLPKIPTPTNNGPPVQTKPFSENRSSVLYDNNDRLRRQTSAMSTDDDAKFSKTLSADYDTATHSL